MVGKELNSYAIDENIWVLNLRSQNKSSNRPGVKGVMNQKKFHEKEKEDRQS